MEQSGTSIVCNTRELREIAREAHKRGLNRQLKPAQFKLLDPRGTHILSPQFMHDKADGNLVEPHLRCYCHIKLLGKQKAIERQLDIPKHLVEGYFDEQPMIEMGRSLNAMDDPEEFADKLLDESDGDNLTEEDVSKLGDAILEEKIAKRDEVGK